MKNKPTATNSTQRHQFGDGEDIGDQRRRTHAADIDRRDHDDDCGDEHNAPTGRCRARPEVSQVVQQQVAQRGERGDPRQPHQPADLETDHRAERGARIQIRPAVRLKRLPTSAKQKTISSTSPAQAR